jgi:hypothetical protein
MPLVTKIYLDTAGVAEVLKSAEVADEIEALAEDIRGIAEEDPSVVAHDVPVEVEPYTTDRAAVGVTLQHPAGMGIEAKYGVLASAAGEIGLKVKRRKAKR